METPPVLHLARATMNDIDDESDSLDSIVRIEKEDDDTIEKIRMK